MLKFDTIIESITICPYRKFDKYNNFIMVGSIECSHCLCYKGIGACHNTIICEAEENNVNVKKG
jgi:hypothetical protein